MFRYIIKGAGILIAIVGIAFMTSVFRHADTHEAMEPTLETEKLGAASDCQICKGTGRIDLGDHSVACTMCSNGE